MQTNWVDYAKAIGIILVVYGHVVSGVSDAGIDVPSAIAEVTFSIVYSFHMPLFFFLSGLFFFSSLTTRGNGTKLCLSKVDTIIYPYVAWSILHGLIELLMSNYTNGDITAVEVFSLWEPRAHFWFLYALFIIFSINAFIFSIIRDSYVVPVLIVAAATYITRESLPDFRVISFVSYNWVYFVLGMLFTKYNAARFFSSKSSVIITLTMFCIFQYIYHGHLDLIYTSKGLISLSLACVSIAFVVSLSMAMSKTPINFIAYIGSSSMAIYLMHILSGSATRIFISHFTPFEHPAVHIVAGCAAGLLLPLLAIRIIKTIGFPYAFSAPVTAWVQVYCNLGTRKPKL